MAGQTTLQQLVDRTERIGVIGSPSSTSELTLDILGVATNKKLVGELSLFRFLQDDRNHFALGQITEVELHNIWMQDATMRSLIRQRGRVDPVSERQDTHIGKMSLSAVFKEGISGFEPSILGTVPATGTPIHLANDDILDKLLEQYRREIFYLGYVYGSTPKLPLWFKHFDSGPAGAGEAYHLGIFGKTGSGKSVLAKMIMLAYARHAAMSIFVLDPQGEFTKDMRGQVRPDGFPLELGTHLRQLNKQLRVVSIQELILDRWELFQEILYESLFFERLTIPKGENRRLAAENLVDELRRQRITLDNLHARPSFDAAWRILGQPAVQTRFYRTDVSRQRFDQALRTADANQFYQEYWLPIARLFQEHRQNAVSVDALLHQTFNLQLQNRPVTVIDLSGEGVQQLYWNDTIKLMVIRRFLDGLVVHAEQHYQQNRSLNTLVIVDEAHRLAPREHIEDEALQFVRNRFIDAVRTTRKYGLGWTFISQTLSSLHREIIQQIRIFFFGFGLALGTEFQALRELIGGDQTSIRLYQKFRDPHSAFDSRSREYPFMTVGPVSPLSFAGTPLFFTAFNNAEEFLQQNRLNPPQVQLKL
jgi:hypothetical protein